MSTATLAVIVASAALLLHGAAAVFITSKPVPADPATTEPRATRAATGSGAGLAYLLFAALDLAGVHVTGHDGITAASLTVFGLTQVAWLINTAWDTVTHAQQVKGAAP